MHRRLGVMLCCLLVSAGCTPMAFVAKAAAPGEVQKVVPADHLEVLWHGRLVQPGLLDYQVRERSRPAWDPEREWVFVGDRKGRVHAIDRLGRPQWTFQAEGDVDAGLCLHGDRLYVATTEGIVYALDAPTGKKLWRYDADVELGTTPTWADGTLVLTSLANTVVALDTKTGKLKWFHRGPAPGDLTIRGSAGAALAGDRVVTGFSDGTVVALALDDGRVLWRRNVAGKGQFVDVDTTPVVFNHQVFVADYDGALFDLDVGTGKVIWQVKAIASGVELRRVADMLVLLGPDMAAGYRVIDGKGVWQTQIEGGAPTAPAVLGQRVLLGTSEGPLYALDARTGKPETSFAPGNGIAAAPAVGDDVIWVFSNGGYLYRLAWR